METINAILYARVSSREKERTKYGLSRQNDKMRRFCADNDIRVVDCFEDTSCGWSMDRPSWSKVIDFLKAHPYEINFLFVSSWDRLSTYPDIVQDLIQELSSNYGVTIQATEFIVDYDNPKVMEMIAFQILFMPLLEDDLLDNI